MASYKYGWMRSATAEYCVQMSAIVNRLQSIKQLRRLSVSDNNADHQNAKVTLRQKGKTISYCWSTAKTYEIPASINLDIEDRIKNWRYNLRQKKRNSGL